ncbi:MAG: hypothetical protein ACK526_20735 [Planctomyces sp.]
MATHVVGATTQHCSNYSWFQDRDWLPTNAILSARLQLQESLLLS